MNPAATRPRPSTPRPARAALVAAAVLSLAATPAWANAGTPLMWLAPLHLVFGNAIIGFVEGALLALVFRVRVLPALAWMIAANYFSMTVGMMLLQPIHEVLLSTVFAGRERIFAAPDALAVVWTIAVIGTMVVEWPIVLLALWQGKGPWRAFAKRAVIGTLLIHSVSYACIIPLYQGASSMSLHTQFRGEPSPASVAGPAPGWVYYLDHAAAAVKRIRLDGSEAEHVADFREGWEDATLVPVAADDGGWELRIVLNRGGEDQTPIASARTGRVVPDQDAENRSPGAGGIGRVTDLQHETKWEAFAGFWALEGVRFWRPGEAELPLRMAYETLFDRWPIRFVTLLPGDAAVCELRQTTDANRNGWILIVDLEGKRWAPLCRGTSPVVVLDE